MTLFERIVARGLYPISNLLSRAVMKGWHKVSDEQPMFVFRGVPDRLAPEHIAPGAVLHADRETMLAMLPQGAVGAEVGTYRGVFARLLLDACRPSKLYLVDRDFSLVPPALLAKEIADGTVELKVGESADTLSRFADALFDWIYIDGDHRLAGVRKDTAQAHRALKPGGLMMFNDYLIFDAVSGTPFGVMHAANALCIDRGYKIVGFALHRDGYNDILLRKPG